MQREYRSWHSPSLGRTMEFLWFGTWGTPVLVFPTSKSRFHENEDFGLVGALADKIEGGQIQVVCVDSVDMESWYCGWAHPAGRVRRHDQFEQYLTRELIPYIFHRTHQNRLATYGASFGAYHAANLAARHPELVYKAILFSGIYDIHDNLAGYWDDLCYFHCPMAYIPNLDRSGSERLSQVQWVIATGEHDSLVEANRRFSGLLSAKGIRNHCEIWPGVFGHDWPWWKQHLRRFLP